jgi:integrase
MARKVKGVTPDTKNGVKYWRAYIDGKYVSFGPGEEGRKTAVAAKRKWEAKKFEMKAEAGGLNIKRNAFKTIGELMKWYLDQPSIQSQKKYRAKYCRMKKHLVPFFGNKPLKYAEPEHQEKYIKMRTEQGHGPVTIAQEIQYLRAAFKLSYKRRKILDEILPREWLTDAEINPRRVITDHEYKKLLRCAPDEDFKDFMIAAHETGMRLAEVYNLRKNQVRLNQRHFDGSVADTIYLGIFDTKTSAERIVPVSPELKQILERRIADIGPDDHVFTYRPRQRNQWHTSEVYPWKKRICFTRSTVNRKFAETCDRASILRGDKHVNEKGEKIGIVFHCFRHTRTSKWVEMGFNDQIIMRATGHKSLEAYRRYVHLDARAVMRLVGRNDSDDMRKTREKKEVANASVNHKAGRGDAQSARVHG